MGYVREARSIAAFGKAIRSLLGSRMTRICCILSPLHRYTGLEVEFLRLLRYQDIMYDELKDSVTSKQISLEVLTLRN